MRHTIANATPGDTIIFSVTGTITLTSGELVIDKNLNIIGSEAFGLIISGNKASRVFAVEPNIVLTAVNLTIADGMSTNGGGIYNEGGTITLLNVILESNVATNASGDACGGAIFNASGAVNATNCAFLDNEAQGGAGTAAINSPSPSEAGSGISARGGAVFNAGRFIASRCSFVRNQARGGPGGAGLSMLPPPWDPTGESYFFSGGSGGAAEGAAVCNLGMLLNHQSLLASNLAMGGTGGAGVAASQEVPCGPVGGAAGGSGGDAKGSAVSSEGAATLFCCTLVWNASQGGPGADGGDGTGITCHGGGRVGGSAGGDGGAGYGAVCSHESGLSMLNCTLYQNVGNGGAAGRGGIYGGLGGTGGNGYGAIYNTQAAVALLSCTLADNLGNGGLGGISGGDSYLFYYDPPDGSGQVISNFWPGPPDGADGIGVGGISPRASLLNTLFGFNEPINCSGTMVDLGHNLSSDGSCAFTNTGSLNTTDPDLGPLGDHGGPTPTIALLLGSPAIDAGDTAAAPPTDQRGLPRPYGQAADIGAYESQIPSPYAEWLLSYGLPTDGSADAMDEDGDGLNTWQEWRCLTNPTNALSVLRLLSAMPDRTNVTVTWQSNAGVSYFLERCTNLALLSYEVLAPNILGQSETTTFTDTNAPGSSTHFYRVGVAN